MLKQVYNPDVLTCIANLSSDEVFTPPSVVNQMLDTLPKELWSNEKTTFLDPVSKSGVFLREITKRLIDGLESKIPNLKERLEHILRNQVFGIGITELTSLISRRSLYCSKYANGKYSIVQFDDEQGNLKYFETEHTWKGGSCKYCGVKKEIYDRGDELENYSYSFIHSENPEKLFNMKFDVIIGNPPYQLSFGIDGGNKSNAKSIYNLFIEQGVKLNPKYLVMITPSRWMTKTSQGIPDSWVDDMISSNKLRKFYDYEDSKSCFPGVDIKGGVSYFLWEKDYDGKCEYHYIQKDGIISKRIDYLDSMNSGMVIRDPGSYEILQKVINIEGDFYNKKSFSSLVSPKHFYDDSSVLTSNWSGYSKVKTNEFNIKYYLNKNMHKIDFGWIKYSQIPKKRESVSLNKVYIPGAGGSGNDSKVLGIPFKGEPNSVCSQTYLVIGYDNESHNFSEKECDNIIDYIKTRFFRYLVSIIKKTQNGPRGVYRFVPVQDFNEKWTDEKLYLKYGLSKKQIEYIESLISPME
jgi:site-specific DNA-methyltransferase (adenine-specific)